MFIHVPMHRYAHFYTHKCTLSSTCWCTCWNSCCTHFPTCVCTHAYTIGAVKISMIVDMSMYPHACTHVTSPHAVGMPTINISMVVDMRELLICPCTHLRTSLDTSLDTGVHPCLAHSYAHIYNCTNIDTHVCAHACTHMHVRMFLRMSLTRPMRVACMHAYACGTHARVYACRGNLPRLSVRLQQGQTPHTTSCCSLQTW